MCGRGCIDDIVHCSHATICVSGLGRVDISEFAQLLDMLLDGLLIVVQLIGNGPRMQDESGFTSVCRHVQVDHFGCGMDIITTDEIARNLGKSGLGSDIPAGR